MAEQAVLEKPSRKEDRQPSRHDRLVVMLRQSFDLHRDVQIAEEKCQGNVLPYQMQNLRDKNAELNAHLDRIATLLVG